MGLARGAHAAARRLRRHSMRRISAKKSSPGARSGARQVFDPGADLLLPEVRSLAFGAGQMVDAHRRSRPPMRFAQRKTKPRWLERSGGL